jgi:Hsp70 protein
VADGLGLSVGAANLSAVVVDRAAVTRTAVLTLYPDRPPEVGLPSENPNLAQRGLIINDFVDRTGDPVGIIAQDGSSHRAEVLLADALRATLYAVTRGRPPADPVGVSHPAHWRPSAVAALRGALAAVPEFGAPAAASLVSDAVAGLTALQRDPGLPARGIVAVCDFGGTGTSITLADAARGFVPMGPTVRHVDLSGDLIDQALLTHVIADFSAAGSLDVSSTSAIGSLTRLRAQCRAAKERLSTAAVTSLTVELAGQRGEVRITRNELDDVVRQPLLGFVDELRSALQRSGIRSSDLVAVASVGGGARIPIVTTTLSEHLRIPVVTGAQPELAAAIGAGLRAVRGTVEEGATSVAVLPQAAVAVEPAPTPAPAALAWSEDQDVPDVAPSVDYDDGPRPELSFVEADDPDRDQATPSPWYRRPFAFLAAGIAVVLAAIAAVVVLLMNGRDEPTPSTLVPMTTTTSTATATNTATATATPPQTTAAPPSQAPSAPSQAPEAPETRTITEELPPATNEAPPPQESVPPPAENPPQEPPPATPEPTTPPPLIPTLPYETIPGLPFVPAPIQPPPP